MSRSRSAAMGGAFLAGIAVLLTFSIKPIESIAAPPFSEWSEPVNLGPLVNSTDGDFAPHISKKGLSLYFASNRPGPHGGEDIWVSQRPNTGAPWGAPVNLGAVVNTPFNDRSPALSRDGHLLFFASDRPGGSGALDIWVAWRAHTKDDFGWQPPVNLSAVNSAATDAGPSFFENDDVGIPQLFIASSRLAGLHLYFSTLTAAGSWGTPLLIPELNSTGVDLTPTIRHDGLEIIFASNRPGSVAQDLWASTREAVGDTWSTPVNLGPLVNSASSDNFPSLSSDGESLFFNASRADSFGQNDLYVSVRQRK